jgi:hypothetical protein
VCFFYFFNNLKCKKLILIEKNTILLSLKKKKRKEKKIKLKLNVDGNLMNYFLLHYRSYNLTPLNLLTHICNKFASDGDVALLLSQAMGGADVAIEIAKRVCLSRRVAILEFLETWIKVS